MSSLDSKFTATSKIRQGDNSNYGSRIIKNSAWSGLNFFVTGITGFFISVILTRYFGKENYGIYSYFIWLGTILGILGGFGLNRTAIKYLPHYFFSWSEKPKACALFKKLLKIQLILATATMGGLLVIASPIKSIIGLNTGFAEIIIIIASLNIIPFAANSFCASTISTLQQFRKLALIQMFASVINLIAIFLLAIGKHNLTAFFWLFLGINFFLALNFVIATARLFKIQSSKTSGAQANKPMRFPKKEMIIYSFWNYISVCCEQVVWERSEIFFLGLFSNAGEIGVYALAYSLAMLLVNFFAPINTVLNYTTAEIVTPDKQYKLKYISKHATKYLAIIMLPALIYGTVFIGDVVGFIYGQNFKQVALLFPLLAVSHVIAMIVSPAANVPNLKNEAYKITFITVVTAILNLGLGFYLIPRNGAFGAAIANTLAQFFSITLVLFNARKYKLHLLNWHFMSIFLINSILGIFMFIVASSSTSLLIKIFLAAISSIIYVMFTIKFAFNRDDVYLLQNLQPVIPKVLYAPYRLLLKQITANAHSD